MRRPPTSPLFPYTTLFRSPLSTAAFAWTGRLLAERRALGHPVLSMLAGADFHSPEDRKSTRLNSSHVASSYAVFCLKKKNTQRIQPSPVTHRPTHHYPG